MTRQEIAFVALGASCIVGACLIARLEKRVRTLEEIADLVHEYLNVDFQKEVDEKFDEIVDQIDE